MVKKEKADLIYTKDCSEDNFKKDLLVLVKDYGFKIDYLTTNENYYNDLMNGKLSNWFKKMYLKNHLICLNQFLYYYMQENYWNYFHFQKNFFLSKPSF